MQGAHKGRPYAMSFFVGATLVVALHQHTPSVSSIRVGRQAGTELAMTGMSPRSRRVLRARFALNFGLLINQRAWGDAGRPMRRSLACEVVVVEMHTSIHSGSTRNHPASPHAMVLRLIRDLPGEPCTFATVALGFKVLSDPVEPNEPPQDLTPAWGRQDHTT